MFSFLCFVISKDVWVVSFDVNQHSNIDLESCEQLKGTSLVNNFDSSLTLAGLCGVQVYTVEIVLY